MTASHRYCGTQNDIEYNSQYRALDVRFKTNEAIEKSGFEFTAQSVPGICIKIISRFLIISTLGWKILTKCRQCSYSIDCQRSYTALQGRVHINTMNNCEATIQVPENNTIALYYSTTNIYTPSDCSENQTIVKVWFI